MADSAKLSRSAPAAPRARTNETINANTKLFAAIQTKDAAALKLALDSGEDKNAKNAAGTSALSLCVQNEQLNLVRQLIAAGADVNALDARGVSPLTHARNQGFTDIVNLLLNAGAK
jgi:ankyrin repeat protein